MDGGKNLQECLKLFQMKCDGKYNNITHSLILTMLFYTSSLKKLNSSNRGADTKWPPIPAAII